MRESECSLVDGGIFAEFGQRVKITYYVEVLSSWCMWVEPTWLELKRRYGEGVEFQWEIALMRPADFPATREQCEWFYRRSGGTVIRSPFMLNSRWFEPERQGNYEAPNLVAEAGKDFGYQGDELRLALSHAALREGRRIGGMDEAVAVAAAATGVDPNELRSRSESAEIKKRAQASTAEFLAHQINQRPAFVLEDRIGDKAVFSGLVRLEPLVATIDAMMADTAAYAAHAAHFGTVPAAPR